MTDRTLVVIGRSMASIGIVATLVAWSWMGAAGAIDVLFHEWLILNGMLAIGFGLIAWIVLPGQPRNGAIWPSAIVALTSGTFVLLMAQVWNMARNLEQDLGAFVASTPSDLSTGQAFVLMMASWLSIPFVLVLTVGLVLFPDGRPPSPRWRWTVWAAYGVVAVQSAALMWIFRPSGTTAYSAAESTADFLASLGLVVAVAEIGSLVLIPVCVTGLVVKFRRSSGVERQQFRLVVWGTGAAATLALLSVVGDLSGAIDPRWPALLMTVLLVGSYGVAIGKYRLYDIDVVISRTFVYASLAVFITAVYVGIVVGVGFLLGAQDEPNVWLGITATVVIAIAFQPLRRRLQRVANRMVFGRRATPYEVLSSFSQRVAVVDPEVLGQVARSLTEGTTAVGVTIWTRRGQSLHRIASWPVDRDVPSDVSSDTAIPGADRLADITHDDEHLGFIGLSLPTGQPLPPADEELLEQVAGGLGLALRNLLLTEDLQVRVDQLRESRRRVVAVQDQTRQMLERDLHDGAQQRLVALKIKVGIGASMAEKQDLDDVKRILNSVRNETDLTIESLRNLARGIYPPLLEAEGLGPALTAQLRRAPLPVTVQAAGIERQPREIEATVYFCVLEAVQNAIKHAQAKSVLVTLGDEEGQLTFEVRDDGIGFDPRSTSEGNGLLNMSDRLDAGNGGLDVSSTSEHGTRVHGWIPIRQAVPA